MQKYILFSELMNFIATGELVNNYLLNSGWHFSIYVGGKFPHFGTFFCVTLNSHPGDFCRHYIYWSNQGCLTPIIFRLWPLKSTSNLIFYHPAPHSSRVESLNCRSCIWGVISLDHRFGPNCISKWICFNYKHISQVISGGDASNRIINQSHWIASSWVKCSKSLISFR